MTFFPEEEKGIGNIVYRDCGEKILHYIHGGERRDGAGIGEAGDGQ